MKREKKGYLKEYTIKHVLSQWLQGVLFALGWSQTGRQDPSTLLITTAPLFLSKCNYSLFFWSIFLVLHWLWGNRVELLSGTAQLHSLMKEVNGTGPLSGIGACGKSREDFFIFFSLSLNTHALICSFLCAPFGSVAADCASTVPGSACHVQPQQQEERLQQIGR